MKCNSPNNFIRIFVMISAIITTLIVYQSSYAQLQENFFNNTTKPLIENISGPTQQSSIQFSPEPILMGKNLDGNHLVWEELVNGKSEIFYAKRTGSGFDYKTNLSNSNSVDSIKPSMLIDNQNIYFTWWEIYDNGTQNPHVSWNIRFWSLLLVLQPHYLIYR